MKLPPREYYTVNEAAVRWGCTIADVAAWASKGEFDIVTGVPPIMCGAESVAGEVVISAFDMLPMFRRYGNGPREAMARRVHQPGSTEWLLITDPVGGIEVSLVDMLIRGDQIRRFEDGHDLLRRTAGGPGSISPYDWEGMMAALVVRIHEQGLPASQAELIRDMQDWFLGQPGRDDIPDERSIRRRIAGVWKALAGLQAMA